MSQDSKLQQTVLAELTWEPRVNAAHIGVAANTSIVTLTGRVETFAEKRAAEAAAIRVKGVQAVVDEVVVRLPVETRRTDEEIAAAVVNRLDWNSSIPAGAVKVTVENGWVTLSGEVDKYHQKEAAVQDISQLLGVVGIHNQITLKPKVRALIVRDDIIHALYRSWFFDPVTIDVTAEGGMIHLTGTVRSPHERQVAAATAWAEPGVSEVKNDIQVT